MGGYHPKYQNANSKSAYKSETSWRTSEWTDLVIPARDLDDVALSLDGVDAERRLAEEEQMAHVVFALILLLEDLPTVRRVRTAQLGAPEVVLDLQKMGQSFFW